MEDKYSIVYMTVNMIYIIIIFNLFILYIL
jgi:hypothetical protein